MNYDILVLGGGPGGYVAAIRAAQLGAHTALIEERELGGTCLNRGCIPTMIMAKAAEILDQTKNAKDFGITFSDCAIDFGKLEARKKTVVKILTGGVRSLLEAYGIELLPGTARFIAPLELAVDSGDGNSRHLAAQKMIIAAGTTEAPSGLPGDAGLTVDTAQLLDQTVPPSSVLILGGGFIGLTFATILSCFGTRVTLIEGSERLLPEIDEEIVGMLLKELKKSKIRVITGARPIKAAMGQEDQIEVEIEVRGERTGLRASSVLRTARQPDTAALNLTALGLKLNEHGGLATDLAMKTNIDSVFAAGDVTMEHMWTPVAYAEGVTAAENIAGSKTRMEYSAIPCWTSTMPAVCGAGMTEAGAIAKGYNVRVGRFSFGASGMAAVLGRRTGMIKIVTEARYGQILGVHVIGQGAAELVHEALLAIKSELTPRDIGGVFHVHPSFSECIWEAARAVNGESIHSFGAGP